MNFKIIIALILLPLSVMAQNRTNQFDNIFLKNGFTFTGGTVGANRVLTSDASGNYTPQAIVSLNAAFLTNLTTSSSGVTWTGQGTHIMDLGLNFTIFVTNGSAASFTTVNGMTPATFVTNVTSSTLTVTGQGTHTLNVEGGSGAAALTNAANFFTAASTNTFNAALLISNLNSRGGIIFYRQEKTANYTNTSSDYYISWKGTTVAQPTNFLATGHSNGRTFVIKDGQRSASTTNIVIKPLGTDTIMGTNSFILNINSQSATVTFDGVSNWELN